MLKCEIKHRLTDAVICAYEAAPLREAVMLAVGARADLARANLARADLAWANLARANLAWADLARANLARADLARADLAGANLAGADLARANLARAYLDGIKADFFAVLDATPGEVAGLREALVAGEVDGSTYEGECACLVGTIAHVRGCRYDAIPELRPDADRPAERWFLAIRRGHTPETSPFARITVGWIDEWLASRAVAPTA